MATALRRRRLEAFEIHEDEPEVPSAADTEMQDEDVEQVQEEEEEQDAASASSDDESDGEESLADDTQEDMRKIEKHFSGFRRKFRLIKRIGEGVQT
jgi:cell division control protein 7